MATEDHHQRSFQQDSHSNSPGLARHSGFHPYGQGGSGLHQYSRHQQIVPQTAVVTSGYTYPNPPAAYLNASHTTAQNMYQEIRSPSFGSHGGASSSPSVAQRDISKSQSPASHRGTVGSQMPGPSRNNKHVTRMAMPATQPLEENAQSSSSRWHRDTSKTRTTQRVAESSTPSPHPMSVPYQNPYSPSQIDARPIGQSVHARDSARERRRSAALGVDDEVAGSEGSKGEENNKASEEQYLSKTKGVERAKKTSTAKGNVSRGLTRTNADGELEWRATDHGDGVLAVRHYDIRSQLIAKAEAERVALGVQIEHPDEPGPGIDNVTSFYRKHVTWGPDREDRPEILFAWEEDREKNPRPKFPGWMNWEENGKEYLVLDPHDNRIKDWDIPATLASNVPGYKLEAMRRENMSLRHKDFWSRMPNRINVGTEQSPKWKELATQNSAVNNPMERFRSEAGLSSWTKRKNTLVIKEGLRKLYVNVLQNNSFKAFGRDIIRKEVQELKKGEEAIFPIDFVHWTEPARPKDNIEASEEAAQSPLRSRKRGRQCSEESSIAAEVDDLEMFESSADEEYENDPTQQNSPRRTRRPAATRHGERIEESSEEDSAETEVEEIPDHRSASERIPETGDFGGKSKEPSCTSSTDDPSQRNQEKESRRMEVLGNWGQSAYYARYQDLSSNEPAHHAGISDAPLQTESQTPEINSTSLEHNNSSSSQSHASEAIMNGPSFEWNYPEGEFTALQAHRRRVKSFFEDKDALKRLRTGQPVLRLPAAATNRRVGNTTPQVISR